MMRKLSHSKLVPDLFPLCLYALPCPEGWFRQHMVSGEQHSAHPAMLSAISNLKRAAAVLGASKAEAAQQQQLWWHEKGLQLWLCKCIHML